MEPDMPLKRFPIMMIVGLLLLTVQLNASPDADPGARPAGSDKQSIPNAATPADALLRGAEICDHLDVDEAMELYDCQSEEELKTARAICENTIAYTKLEHAVTKKFGKESSDAVVHAAGQKIREDVKAADVKTDGDRAEVQFKGDGEVPFVMKRVKGVWKISTREVLDGIDKDSRKAWIDGLKVEANDILKIERDVSSGKYKTGEEVIASLKHMSEAPSQPAEEKGK
jgi:hypothetical protein